jgi:hypothetical protein
MRDELRKILEAINSKELPKDFTSLFADVYNSRDNVFTLQETTIIDFKESIPDSNDKVYVSGILRLICSFHNSYGGLIVFGVRDQDFKVVGLEGGLDIELYNSLARDIFGMDCELVRRDYEAEGAVGSKITVLLIPKRPSLAPLEARRSYHKISAGEVYFRDRHESLVATDRNLSFLFSERDPLNDESDPHPVNASLPPSPATLPKYVGRFDLMKKIWTWFRFGKNPRLYLSGPGGSGKSTLAYEFAERIASSLHDLRARNGEKIDLVLYLSAKETELNVHTGAQQSFRLRNFSNAEEQIKSILVLSGLCDEGEIANTSYDDLLETIDFLFDNFNCLVVIDDIDALIRAGVDTGEEDIFLKASQAKKSIKILYTLRNDATYAKNSSIPVPGLEVGTELPKFIDACCSLFEVPPPTALEEANIIAESSRLPLLVETLVGLRKNSSSYDQALRDFREKGGDEARRYLYQREYDLLDAKGKSRQILATLMLYKGPLGFDALAALTSSTPEQTRNAINETANIFLKISYDEQGKTIYTLSPSAQSFVRAASTSLAYISAVTRSVEHFKNQSARATAEEASTIIRLESLVKSKRFNEATSLDRELASEDPVRSNPRFMSLLGQAFCQSTPPNPTRARDLFSSADKFGFKDVFMMRAWYHVERGTGYRYPEAAAVCQALLAWQNVSDRHRSEFSSKLGECLALQAKDSSGEGPDRAVALLCSSVVAYLQAIWIGKSIDELDSSKSFEWLQRANNQYSQHAKGDMLPMLRSLDGFFKAGYGIGSRSILEILRPAEQLLLSKDIRVLRKLQATLASGVGVLAKSARNRAELGASDMLSGCVNLQKRVEIRIMELSNQTPTS